MLANIQRRSAVNEIIKIPPWGSRKYAGLSQPRMVYGLRCGRQTPPRDWDISSMAVIASDARIADMQQNYPPRSAVISWIFFDWAAQPYFTLITTFVFAPYF